MNTPHQGRRSPKALSLLAVSACILLGALFLGVVAPPAQAAGTGSISGWVTDAGGPLLGVKVTAYLPDSHGGWGDKVAGAVSDKDGYYDISGLSWDTYRIKFADPAGNYITQYYDKMPTINSARGLALDTATPAFAHIDAVLVAPAGHIIGTVTDASVDYNPLSNISVRVFASADDFQNDNAIALTQTALDGTYHLDGLPAGDHYIVCFDDDIVGSNYATQFYDRQTTTDVGRAKPVTVTPGGTARAIDAVLVDAGHIKGRVADANDAPLKGISVNAYASVTDFENGHPAAWGRQTDSNGIYDLGDVPVGDGYLVEFSDDAGNYLTQFFHERPTIDSADPVSVVFGTPREGVNAVLAPAGHISGTVTDTHGSNLANISVNVFASADDYQNGNPTAWTQTAADGTYDLGGLPAGSGYIVRFDDDNTGNHVEQFYDHQPSSDSARPVSVTAGETTEGIDATLALAGHITGAVTDANGAPLPGIWVNVYASLDDYNNGNGLTGTQTDQHGFYDLNSVPAGDGYIVEFSDSDNGAYLPQCYLGQATAATATPVTVTFGVPLTGIDAVLAPAGRITGRVTDANGDPLADMMVSVFTSVDNWNNGISVGSAQADENGYYILGLPAGIYLVQFNSDAAGYYASQFYPGQPTFDAATPVAVTVGQATELGDANLPVAGHITGTLLSQGGGPLQGIWVFVCTPDGKGGWTYDYGVQTDETGSYDLGGLPADTYRLEFWDGSGTYVDQCYKNASDLDSAQELTVDSGATISDINAVLVAAGGANTYTGSDHTVTLPADAALTFAEVTAPGVPTVTTSATDPGPAPAPFQVAGAFFQIATSATFSGPVTVALPYDPTGLTLAQQQALKIMHLDSGVWTDVTTSVDTTAHIVYGSVAHFSWLVLAVDTTPPTTTCGVTTHWYNADVPVVLTATDSGSGVATIQYKLGSASSWTSAIPDAQGQVSLTVGGEGRFSLIYRATDVAGNTEAQHSVGFGIDRHAPLTVVDYYGAWSKAPVALHFLALDLLSGVAATQSSVDNGASWQTGTSRTVSAEGQTTVLYRSSDEAGNVEAYRSVTVKIDKTVPLIGITTPADGATYLLNQAVKASWSATDALSGLASTKATTSSGAAIATSKVTKLDPKTGKPVGLTYAVTATDKVGNTATKTVTYFVTYKPPSGFLAPIDANGGSRFRLGSMVTLAFQLTDASGANVSGAAATIAVTQLSTTPTGTDAKPVVTTKPTSGTAFVYNATSKQYVYCLGTSGRTAGDYKVTATLDDGTLVVGRFSLK